MATAPLLLGGCGLPIGIQMASLFADGVSFLATEKSLSDHGISLVAHQDCALWRIVKGESMCREVAPDEILVADAADPGGAPESFPYQAEDFLVAEAPEEIPVTAFGETVVAAVVEPADEPAAEPAGPVIEVAELANLETAAGRVASEPAKTPESEAVAETVAADMPAVPETAPTVVAEAAAPAAEPPQPTAAETGAGGTFLVIASFYRSDDAEQFARGQEKLDTVVLSGTAKGRQVYRVAVGPYARGERTRAKAELVRAGFRDVWALRQAEPEVVVQVAALD